MSAQTVTELDVEHPTLVIRDYWMAALKFFAIGRTAGDFRAQAADAEMTRGLALRCGITEDEERAQVLAIADAIDALTAAGLTPVDCWYLAGLDQFLGTYPGDAALECGIGGPVMFMSRRHAQNTAADLRATADEERARADRNTRNGDVFGADIAASNARVADALAKVADKAAELLREQP